jgi:hypothetical protein
VFLTSTTARQILIDHDGDRIESDFISGTPNI